jgi:type III secretory pathway lipoprotein EscJ
MKGQRSLGWLVAILAAVLVLNGCALYHQAAQSAANELRAGVVVTLWSGSF